MRQERVPKKTDTEWNFRLRGTEVTRVEAFSDVVFGFALTLLVVSLEVPKTYAELMQDMRGFVPFALSFAMLAQVWWTHHKFFRRYGLQDTYTMLLNLVLLFVVLFYVYPLKFLFNGLFEGVAGHQPAPLPSQETQAVLSSADTATLMVIYGLGFASIFLLFTLMYLHAYGLRGKLELDELECHDTWTSLLENGWFVIIGIVSVLIAISVPARMAGLAGFVYFLIPVGMTYLGSSRGAGRRRLIERVKHD